MAEHAVGGASGASSRHVVLVGLMGTGKSTVGRLLAQRLGRRIVDSDALVEASAGRTVRQIFADDGEPAFRALETAALVDALGTSEPLVIAAAGGAVLSQTNRDAIRTAAGVVVWLRADPHVLVGRVSHAGHRPLLDDDPEGTLRRMAAERESSYREVADVVVDTDARSPEHIADQVARHVTEVHQ